MHRGKFMLHRIRFIAAICVLLTGSYVTTQSQELTAQPMVPKLIRCTPESVTPGVRIELDGYRFGAFGSRQVKVLFVQGEIICSREPTGGGEDDFKAPQNSLQHLSLAVPEGLNPGNCQIMVEVDEVASEPIMIEIAHSVSPAVISNLRPSVAQPGEIVWIDAVGIGESDEVELADVSGKTRHITSGTSTSSGTTAAFALPLDLSDGEFRLSIVEKRSGLNQRSNSLSLRVNTGPAPLIILPDSLKPIAPGQWLDLLVYNYIALERAEEIEVAFIQGNQVIVPVEGRRLRLRVPRSLFAGQVRIMTRTWREGRASSWSEPIELQLLEHPAAPYIRSIQVMKSSEPNDLVEPISVESNRTEVITAQSGDTLVLNGAFLAASVSRLRVELEGSGKRIRLIPDEFGGPAALKFTIPRKIRPGDWQVKVRDVDTSVSIKLSVILRIE